MPQAGKPTALVLSGGIEKCFRLAPERALHTASHSRSLTELLDPLVLPGPEYRNPFSNYILAPGTTGVKNYKVK